MFASTNTVRNWITQSGADLQSSLGELNLAWTLRKDLDVVERIAAIGSVIWSAAQEIASQLIISDVAAIYSCLDSTTLDSKDSDNNVRSICQKAATVGDRCPGLPCVAAICVYPVFTPIAKESLGNSGIKLAVVEDAFPHGQSLLAARVNGVKLAVDAGAQEIDMVIRRGLVLEGNFHQVATEVRSLREASGAAHLKVILNTEELSHDPKDLLTRYQNLLEVSRVCIESGAHMIKTSTGKEGRVAVIEDSIVMYDAIAAAGNTCGFKAAGGVKTVEDAVAYFLLAQVHLKPDHSVTPDIFRIGASSLGNELEKKYEILRRQAI